MGEVGRHVHGVAYESVILQVEAVHVFSVSFENVERIHQADVDSLVGVEGDHWLFVLQDLAGLTRAHSIHHMRVEPLERKFILAPAAVEEQTEQ